MIVVATTMRNSLSRCKVTTVPVSNALRLCVYVDRGAAPVAGHVVIGCRDERGFTGWTELFSILQAAATELGEAQKLEPQVLGVSPTCGKHPTQTGANRA